MKPNPNFPRRLGITRRIALLSWLTTTVTLVIFMFVIIPEQKRTYLENLESKARGISASLQDVTAGAVVTEDYSSVVDHCKQVLQGDRSITFLVITKNDGFSLIHETGVTTNATAETAPPQETQWRTDNLNDYWHPAARVLRSGIEAVPVFNRRIFNYAKPFDYSGIEWGWIHVGLSLEAYDQSVKGVYQRTGLLAVLCLLFSLGVSVIYAKRLLRPLHRLNEVVSQVSAGDLSARASIHSGDEIQDLAQSFNTMTNALLQRDRILESVRIAAQQFLTSADWRQVINGVLAKIGQAAAVSRVYVFENHTDPAGSLLCSQRFEWAATGIAPQIANPLLQGFPWRGSGFEASADRLQRGEIVADVVRQLSPAGRAWLEPQGVQSLLLVPLAVEGVWWGFLGLDDCLRERQWTDPERDSLRTAAEMLGAAIARHRTQHALLEAKNTLEQRVLERTRELEEQMAAKEKTHSDLADTQQRLIEASRMAGMAEVATGVLHNVGNVLNSVNVSSNLVIDRLRQSKVANLPKLAGLLEANAAQLGSFLTADPRGRQIPGYLSALAQHLSEEQAFVLTELEGLRKHIDHIKDIVAMQQSYAKVSGVRETVPPAQLVEDALQLNAGALARHGVKVYRQFREVPMITVEKHKVLQILVNLIRNAKYAMDEGRLEDKRLEIRISAPEGDCVRIEVIDNGVGIPAENLTRIFQHGFTTRKEGHGFGLHSGALAARELGGWLWAESNGPGCGATFSLELPQSRSAGEGADAVTLIGRAQSRGVRPRVGIDRDARENPDLQPPPQLSVVAVSESAAQLPRK
ncbi:MAG: ATP-binding protein [Limisphaerales bacterium]